MVSAQFTPAVEFERPTKDGLGEAPREYAQGIGIVFADMRDLVLVGFAIVYMRQRKAFGGSDTSLKGLVILTNKGGGAWIV
jgi:hypothetical protein